MLPVRIPGLVSSRSDADRARVRLLLLQDETRREAEAEATPMFLLPRPRRDLPFVLAPMSRRLSPRETAPPRRRRRDQPRPSSERCRAATMRRRRLYLIAPRELFLVLAFAQQAYR